MRRLDWDSEFFNLEIGEAVDILNGTEYSKYDLIYLKSDKNIFLKGFVINYKENKIVFEKEIINPIVKSHKIKTYDPEIDEINDLYELAYESGKFSRFLKDSLFSLENFKRLYREWINNSINNKFADEILVYKSKNKIIGFVTYKIFNGHAQVGLIAVDKNFQGMGIGKELIIVLELKLFQLGIKILKIPTQLENQDACNFYMKLGYKIVENTTIKHYWKINDTL